MASEEQKKLMREFYERTGFEFLGKEQVRANNPENFISIWNHNISWLRNLVDETDRILNDYRNRHVR